MCDIIEKEVHADAINAARTFFLAEKFFCAVQEGINTGYLIGNARKREVQ